MMRQKRLFAVLAAIVLTLTACTAATETGQSASAPTVPVESALPTATSSPESRDPAPAFSSEPADSFSSTPEQEHILIAYFTWAENTVVEDPSSDEKAQNVRPALVKHVEDMSRYDVVFLGFPNWWYTVPMAVHTFLEEYDFSGKTIVPFVTHGTGGLASTIEDITADLPENVTILEPIGVYRPDADGAQGAVQEWLAGSEIS